MEDRAWFVESLRNVTSGQMAGHQRGVYWIFRGSLVGGEDNEIRVSPEFAKAILMWLEQDAGTKPSNVD